MEGVWGFVVIAGPIILLAAIITGWWKNRTRSRVPLERTEAATREFRERQSAQDRREGR
ncbi:MAG TPA: hypothetical protein VFQ57_09025 [Sphingomonas sp.]|jgi:FtsZ-interacting cell division protein ZipA|nr:hypothetical protein [Sphingomonas sp.]